MHSIIYTGGSKINRLNIINRQLQDWNINQFDIIRLFNIEKSIGINDIKNLIIQINRIPQYSLYTVCIINDGELLTVEAQNALLKTLEEPPKHTKIIIESANTDFLLPTITSRCEIQNLCSNIEPSNNPEIEKLIQIITSGSTGEKMLSLEKTAKLFTDPTLYIYDLFSIYHQKLILQIQTDNLNSEINQHNRILNEIGLFIHKLIQVNRYLKANINPKIAFDILSFS
jgi:hypothetical protein